MKKFVSVLFIILLAGTVMAQTVNPRLLDLSEARASLAGTDEVYVRSINYAGEELSVLLKYDGENGAVIYGPYFEKDKVIPDGIELGYVRFGLEGSNKITITNVIVNDNEAYSGVVKWDSGAGLNLTELNRIRAPKTSDQLIADLNKKYQGQITRLNKEILTLIASGDAAGVVKELQTQIAGLNSEISTLRASAGAGAVKELPTQRVFSGFQGGTELLGNWNVGYSSAMQTDSSQKFAKYSFSLPQRKMETLFGFTAKADSSSWVGYGLHFFASGEKSDKAYGFGQSYLVWLTKDQENSRSEKTYVQLYRSFDDSKMIQVASVSIPEAISSSLKTEVLYNPFDKTIDVYINGEEKLNYRVELPISSGNKIVLRSLGGPVEFKELYVRTR